MRIVIEIEGVIAQDVRIDGLAASGDATPAVLGQADLDAGPAAVTPPHPSDTTEEPS